MRNSTILISVLTAILLVGGTVYFLLPEPVSVPEPIGVDLPETTETKETPGPTTSVIGKSVEGRDISVTTFGTGDTHLLFVGGIHGGYEWNSTLLAYEYIDYLEYNPEEVPEDLTITIIPTLNPDGLAQVVTTEGPFTLADIADKNTRVAEARFNANGVDLNRNFACKWAPTSTWRGEVVSAGTAAFSEPEAAALRDFVTAEKPTAVVFWHSKANNVYASECENGVLPETLTLMSTYAKPAGYGEVPVFDAYPITGDAEGWLASIGIPAVTVEFESGNSSEWTRNLAGIDATLKLYSTAK